MNFIKNNLKKTSLVVLLSTGLFGCATPKAELWGVYDLDGRKEERLYKFYDKDKNGKCDRVDVYRNTSIFSRKDNMDSVFLDLDHTSTIYGEEGVEQLYNKLTKQAIEKVNSE